jgi:hypothetical protein
MADQEITCQGCGRPVPLDTPRTPCPGCGCTKRLVALTLRESVTAMDSLKVGHKDASGFKKLSLLLRQKIARGSRRPAEEKLTLDRTDPDWTVKTHQVWEIDEHGQKRLVHDEQCRCPAKRRPSDCPPGKNSAD